jgi:CelD/BcsL family acetyltransferase involved in cellulose biosynthesis
VTAGPLSPHASEGRVPIRTPSSASEGAECAWRWETLLHFHAVQAIESEWRALLGQGRFCVGPTWVLTSLEQNASRTQPVVITARDDAGLLVGVAPFEAHGAELTFAGQDAGADHLDVLALPQHGLPFARGVLARFAEGPWSRMRLRHVAEEASLRRALQERRWRCAHAERAASVAPWIDATGSFEEWMQRSFGRKQRHEARRIVRRFREQPNAVVERVTRPQEVESALACLFELHERSFAAQGKATVFQGPAVRRFHVGLAQRAVADGSLWLATLKLDGVPLACFYGFRSLGTLHHFQSGVDPTRRSFGPGTVLRWITLEEDVFGQGLSAYDFMDGDEAYKFEWTDRVRTLFDIVVERPSPWGRLRTLVRRGWHRGRRLARSLIRTTSGPRSDRPTP